MDRFDQYRIFVQVAEMGSFIKGAHALDLPRASVSAAIQQLEAQVSSRLLNRTTRKVHLTADGAQLLERVRPLLSDLENIDLMFQSSERQVSGQLRIDVPSRIARRLIAPALPALLAAAMVKMPVRLRLPRLSMVILSALTLTVPALPEDAVLEDITPS